MEGTWYYWDIDFTALSTDEDVCCLTGKISVRATDIFDALDKATERLKTFGFPDIRVDGGNRLPAPWEKKEEEKKIAELTEYSSTSIVDTEECSTEIYGDQRG